MFLLLIIGVVYPQTVVTKIVDPDNGPGTDYTSLRDFSYGEARNLVGLNQIAVALCRSSAGTADTMCVAFEQGPWVTDAMRYIEVKADTGHRATPQWDDSKYRLFVDDRHHIEREIIDAEAVDMVFDGIQFRFIGTGQSNRVLDFDRYCPTVIVKNCYFRVQLVGSGFITVLSTPQHAHVENSIFEGENTKGGGCTVLTSYGCGWMNVINNTFSGWFRNIYAQDGGRVYAVNNLVRNAIDGYLMKGGGQFTVGTDYNSSSIYGDAMVYSPRSSTQFPWYNGAVSDSDLFEYGFHIRDVGFDVGQGPLTNPYVPSTDMEGNLREGLTCYLGADEPGPDNPLPVTLLYFTHSWEANKIVLKWETASEISSAGFEIERNGKRIADYRHYPELCSNGYPSVYEFIVHNPGIHSSKYSLWEVGVSGDRTLLQTILVHPSYEPKALKEGIKVYPNPFNSTTHISFTVNEPVSRIILYDILGKSVADLSNRDMGPGKHTVLLNANGFPSGVYFLVIDVQNRQYTHRIVLNK